MDTDKPDPEALYIVVTAFSSGRVPGYDRFVAGGRDGPRKLPGNHPAVIEHWRDGYFELDLEDAHRREAARVQAAILARLDAAATAEPASAAPPVPRHTGARRRGRPVGSRQYSRDQVIAKYRAEAVSIGRPPRRPELAEALGVTLDTLRGYLTDYKLPWPIE